MSRGLFGWLGGRGRGERQEQSVMGALLLQRGVPAEALEKATRHRHLLRTRLISTLVEHRVFEETVGVSVLSNHLGVPGVCLRQSLIDLSLNRLPETYARDKLVLPIQKSPEGSVLLATADPLDDTELQTIELLLGTRVQPHLALELFLRRAIVASEDLLREHEDAAYLVGEEVEDPSTSAQHVHSILPQATLPTIGGKGEPRPKAIVGVRAPDKRERLVRELSELGLHVVAAEDGPTVLRALATEPPVLLLLDAQLSGRSGVEIMRRVGTGPRYQGCTKLLVLPASLAVHTESLTAITNLALVPEEDLDTSIGSLSGELGRDPIETDAGPKARAQLFRGMALREEGDMPGATNHFREALDLDPLLAEAHRELARILVGTGDLAGAAAGFAWALDLGGATAEDVAALAELRQQSGDLRQAAALWQRAADFTDVPETKETLNEHARSLLAPRAGATVRDDSTSE